MSEKDKLVVGKTNGTYDATHIWVPSENPKSKLNGQGSHFAHRQTSMMARGSTLTIHDCRYTVQVKAKGCCKTQDKEILQGIDGMFKPGMNAIMGPTGSGKSSLLDVLAGRKNPEGLEGTILLDGSPVPENFKCMVGYVVQDDVVMGTLTVRENFFFSANLRLPKSTSDKEKEEKVETVIQELGLMHCADTKVIIMAIIYKEGEHVDTVIQELGFMHYADTKVGNEFIRGVSGGERKRCNIGMELIISPPVLFLDEPTTGLDANTANTVMLLLKKLSLAGRTIIFSIHQPRFSIYRLFDSLFLLSKGQTVYHGPCEESLTFFEQLGYHCQEHNNPPDFFLDVINGDPNATSNDLDQILAATDAEKASDDGTESEALLEKLTSSYKKSQWGQMLKSQLEPIRQDYQHKLQSQTLTVLPRVEYATNHLTQFLYCSGRTLRNLIRNPAVSVLQVLTMVIFGVVVGAIYWQIDDSCTSGLQNRVGAFFFIIMNMVFGNLSAVEIFIKNRAIFLHENVSGFYRVSSYFMSTVVCDIIPMRFLPTLCFSAVTYYMIGYTSDFENFLIYFLSLFMVSLSASALSFFLSAVLRIFAVANLLIAMCYVLMMVFSGLLVNLETVPEFLRWLKYFSIFRYSFNALSINELKDMTFIDSDGSSNCTTGNEYLVDQGIDYEDNFDLWVNFIALGVMSVGYLVLAFLRLTFMNKLR